MHYHIAVTTLPKFGNDSGNSLRSIIIEIIWQLTFYYSLFVYFIPLTSRFIPIKIGWKERGNCIFGEMKTKKNVKVSHE